MNFSGLLIAIIAFAGGMILLVIPGCTSVDSKQIVNLKGAWLGERFQTIQIITDHYVLSIPGSVYKLDPSKFKYEIVKKNGIWLKRGTSFAKLRNDNKGLYWDSTFYWLGFIPIDKGSPVRKISDDEAIEQLKKRGITKSKIVDLPIKDISDGRISIPDHSAPEIFDRL